MPEKKPQKVATLGVQVKTEERCKICNNPHRGEIEDILVMRSRGERLPDGTRPTEKWLLENSLERWGMKLNKMNIHGHYTKHFRVGNPAQLREILKRDTRTQLEDAMREQGIEAVTPEEYLETIVAIAHAKVKADPASVTTDQGLKAVAELTKRRHDEQTASLMQGLVGAVQTVAQAAGGQMPDTITVEAEVVDDETPEQDGGSRVGPGEGEVGDAALDSGAAATGDLPGHQIEGLPGLRLSDPGQDRVPLLLPGDQGAADEPGDVQ